MYQQKQYAKHNNGFVNRGPRQTYQKSQDDLENPTERPFDKQPKHYQKPQDDADKPTERPFDRQPKQYQKPYDESEKSTDRPYDRQPRQYQKPYDESEKSTDRPYDRQPRQYQKPHDESTDRQYDRPPRQFQNNRNNYQGNNNNNNNNGPRNYNNPRQNRFTQNKDYQSTRPLNDSTYSDAIKNRIMDYVFRSIELSRFKFKLIEFEHDLPLLKERKFFVSPNFNGIHSLLVFIKLQDEYYSCIIDRRTLNYDRNRIEIDKVKMIPIQVRLDKSIYDGTIIDGVLLYNNINGMKNFVINDIYFFRGINICDERMDNKMINFSTFINAYFKQDDVTNNINFIQNKLYILQDIQQLVNVYIPKSKYNNSIKGLSFYSEYSGTKLIYLYNNIIHDKLDELEKEREDDEKELTYDKDKNKPIHKIDVIADGDIVATFRMKKTETIDVYNLYLGNKVMINGKNVLKYIKVGMALIPTKDCSTFCRELFSNNIEHVFVKCKYMRNKSKWVPFELVANHEEISMLDDVNKMTS